MGADFIVAVLPYCQLTPEREKKALEHIQTCTNWDGNGCGSDDIDDCRTAASEAIKDYREFEGRRDTDLFSPGGGDVAYLITGGMSGGDSPTESFDDFNRIDSCDGLWGLLLKWAKEGKDD